MQVLAFWPGFQTVRFPLLVLREIAIEPQLAALIYRKFRGNDKIKLEKYFGDLFDNNLIK